ncbi:MBL fold metallo-hydrolase [Klebsiella sp. C80]|uniref:MBL fold metallo-hydrolase n=1 Tax=Klebsiella TaxID=570 RepID=UPI002152B247|nr:MBL fold metallo-hydrolase [Klebsiella pneumoniae]HBZ7388249.1 MBL fold metallo-hydrolase [Klebsiella pneumoniae]HBZ7393327.1 MBL fold metallo-hydrolase [Klebsiella pneumoniae]
MMQTYQTGDSLIFKVPEREISLQPAALYPEAFPVAEAEAVIQPIALSIHSWVVQTPHDLIVIDTATGNGRERGGNPLYHQLNTPYLENLSAAGVNPEDVTLVLLTHLHTDHVGWNTVWQDDRWVPLFPNARYLCSAKELSRVKNSERYRALWLDSLLPVIEAGQLETVDVATRPRVGGRIDFVPTPGHSPDHAALVLAAGDDYACFSGDLLHSPIQFAHPQWNSAFCGDPRQAEVSRREMMAWGASHHAQWFTGHFAGPSCGWLEKDKQGDYRWREAGKQAADKGNSDE